MRLIAFALVILSGAVMFALGSISERLAAELIGFFVLLIGIALTGGELYLTRFFHDLRAAISTKSPPKPPEAPETPSDSSPTEP